MFQGLNEDDDPCLSSNIEAVHKAQRLINLEVPVLVRSLKSGNVELGWYLDGRLSFKCCLSDDANPQKPARFD